MSQSMGRKPRLLYLLLCEGITMDNQGKKTLTGTFDHISSTDLPFVFPHFCIITGWEGLEGDHLIKVEIETPDEQSIFKSPPLGLRFKAPLRRADGIVEVTNLKFTTSGIHQVKVLLKEKLMMSHPLFIEKIPVVRNGGKKK